MAVRKQAARKAAPAGTKAATRGQTGAGAKAAGAGARSARKAQAAKPASKSAAARGAGRATTAKPAGTASSTAKQAKRKQAKAKQAKAKTRQTAVRALAGGKRAGKKPGKKTARSKAAKLGESSLESSLLDEVEALAKLMETHGLIDVSYAVEPDGTKEIHVSRGGGSAATQAASPQLASAAPVVSVPADTAAAEPALTVDDGLHAFVSPMVGTFYRAPSPEAPAFVSVGDHVDSNSSVCIIEAMKVMNEITPDASGTVVSIEVENGEAVEYGQTLMLIRLR